MNQDKLKTLLKEIVKAIVLLDENTPYTFERHLSTLLTEAFAGDLPKCNCKMYEWEHYPKEFCKPDSCSSKCDEKPEKWKPQVGETVYIMWGDGKIEQVNYSTALIGYQEMGMMSPTLAEAERVKQQWLTMRGV